LELKLVLQQELESLKYLLCIIILGEPWLSEQKNGLKINEKPKDPKLSHCP
jgi:hypothetical protein